MPSPIHVDGAVFARWRLARRVLLVALVITGALTVWLAARTISVNLIATFRVISLGMVTKSDGYSCIE